MNKGRRRLLRALAAGAPLLLVGTGASAPATAASATPCVDLDALPPGDRNLRNSLGFRLQSSDEKKRCGGCAFFTTTSGACGTCVLLSGGSVATTSVCDSWTAKA